MKFFAPFKPLLLRIAIFIGIFLFLTGYIGPWVVSTKLLYGYHFYIYGNMGKLLLISFLLFFIFAKDRLSEIRVYSYEKRNILFLILSVALIPLFFQQATQLLSYIDISPPAGLLLTTHTLLLLIVGLPFFGIFGLKFVWNLWRTFRKELLLCLGISTVLYFAIFQVWKLWPYLSDIVLWVISRVFALVFPIVRLGYDRRILVQDFAVRIDQACSGIEGIFLFSCMYMLIGIVEWRKFHLQKFALLFIPALLGLFITNILRVMILILIGIYISPTLALSLFHTYAGLMLFVIYFLVFWSIFYKRLLKPVSK